MEVGDFGQRLTLLVSRDAKLAWSKVTACHEDTKTYVFFRKHLPGVQYSLYISLMSADCLYICDTWMIWDDSR